MKGAITIQPNLAPTLRIALIRGFWFLRDTLMLKTVVASRFAKPMGYGKTAPCLIGCEDADGKETELIVKFGAGCELKQRGLATEALVAMLGADLDLPVPEPFLVDVSAQFVATIPETDERHRRAKANARASLGLNFGSKKLPPGFSSHPKGKRLPGSLLPLAAEILAFDIFLANPDRVVANANFLIKGESVAIFDHELALFTEGIIGWVEPWKPGGIALLKNLPDGQRHVFLDDVRREPLDLSRLIGAFETISDVRLNDYRAAVPPVWIGDGKALDRMLDYLRGLRQNLDSAVKELRKALS